MYGIYSFIILDIIRVSDWGSAYDQVKLNSRLTFVNMNGILVKGVSQFVNNSITTDEQFYCSTKEVIKSSRVTHF